MKKEKPKLKEIDFLNETEAAEFLGFSRSSLRQWRSQGRGPKFVKFKTGAIRYNRSDLAAWVQSEATLVETSNQASAW